MIKTKITLAPKTLLPIIKHDDAFSHFVKDDKQNHYFSNLICASDFSRVLSQLQLLTRKKEAIACIFHLKQNASLSLLCALVGTYQDELLHICLYDLSSLDQKTLKEITYKNWKEKELLNYV